MTRTHEIRPDLDEGIDRKVLAQLRAQLALPQHAGAPVIQDSFKALNIVE